MKRPDDIDVVNLAQFGTRENGRSTSTSTCPSSGRTDPCSTTDPAARSTRWPTTASGATRTCPGGWGFPEAGRPGSVRPGGEAPRLDGLSHANEQPPGLGGDEDAGGVVVAISVPAAPAYWRAPAAAPVQ